MTYLIEKCLVKTTDYSGTVKKSVPNTFKKYSIWRHEVVVDFPGYDILLSLRRYNSIIMNN